MISVFRNPARLWLSCWGFPYSEACPWVGVIPGAIPPLRPARDWSNLGWLKLSFGSDKKFAPHLSILGTFIGLHLQIWKAYVIAYVFADSPAWNLLAMGLCRFYMADATMTNRKPYQPLQIDSDVPWLCIFVREVDADVGWIGWHVTRPCTDVQKNETTEFSATGWAGDPKTTKTCLSSIRDPNLLLLESILMWLALLCVLALIIVFAIIRVQHRGRNLDPIPIKPESVAGQGKSWKFWNKGN
jgi:hypothetical protein